MLKRANAKDRAAIEMLVQMAYDKWVSVIGRNPLPMDVDYQQALKDHRFDLLYKRGQDGAQNILAALIETYEQVDCLFVENVCVSPRFQRRGLGKQLLAHAEALAIESQKPFMRLDTNKKFSGNVELYHSLGFKTEWEKPNSGGTHVRLCKAL